jgi:glyoxylate reductase
MTKSIFITREIPGIAVQMLENKGYIVDVSNLDKILNKDDLISALKTKPYDAVISLLTDKIDKDILDIAPSVKIFSNYASGFDNIDIYEAKNRGVAVANSPAPYSAIAVAQHTIALIFALVGRIVEANDFVHKGKFVGWEPLNFLSSNLSGKTLGLIGVGRIGSLVANYAKNLGWKIIYVNTNRNEEFEKESGAVFCSSLEDLLPQADFISFHVPFLPSTKHMLNEKNISLMKKTSFLINTSRGAVVDEIALEKALRSKIIAGAALDVFEFEPNITPGLLDLPNVILTPHIASASKEARNQMAEISAQNIIDFFDNKEVKNMVNK